MIDRTKAPALIDTTTIDFVAPKVRKLSPNCTLFWMDRVSDETVRIELQFNAGSNRGMKTVASLVNAMLFSGTAEKNSRQIHEELDALGAYLDHETGLEKAFVSIYCLRANARKVIQLVVESIQGAIFDQTELHDLIIEKKQQLMVSKEKVAFLARQQFQKRVFAGEENYARYTEESDFDFVNTDILKEFHQEYYLKGLRRIVIVANLDQGLVDEMETLFKPWSSEILPEFANHFKSEKGKYQVEKNGAIQTAIRMGRPMFNKTHPDYCSFQFLQTILGDYFGSRLMSNIREDKGYTYGIGCALVELKKSGYFAIITEVATEVAELTLIEIKKEMDRLMHEPVPEDELELVKNYLLGQMLKSADGPNAMTDLFLAVEQYQMEFGFYNQYMEEVRGMTAEKIMDLARKYLVWEDFSIILAG